MNMIKNQFFILLILPLVFNCSTYKKQLISNGSKNQSIENAIIDFSHKNRLYRKYMVFQVDFIDTLYRKKLEKVDGRNYRWVDDRPYEDIYAISIAPITNEYIFLLSDSLGVGKEYLPSRFLEKEGKLFFWRDEEHSANDKTVEVFRKYKLLTEDYLNDSYIVDDSQKCIDYFICRNNLTKYKKVITNKAIGYYDAPRIECD